MCNSRLERALLYEMYNYKDNEHHKVILCTSSGYYNSTYPNQLYPLQLIQEVAKHKWEM